MSRTIDERVVEMQFDNRQFEKNVQTSMNTLDKLKKSLNMDDASKGLDNLDTAANKVKTSSFGLGDAVATVQTKFNALQIMATTALSNIANSIVNVGKQMLRSFTIDPISQGFSEYELKMGSIQTIMASTGESLESVNKYLNELNTYADKTIYSFSDMTASIGKFTNAGVKLDDAVKAIQGISNEAAVSGANADEASRSMYNFAQALSAGYVKLIDWQSIERANMATIEFKNQLLEAAVAAGTLEKTSDGMYRVLGTNANGATMKGTINATKDFNESLSYQWMTTDVLVKTLGDYADETTEIGKKAFAAATEVKTYTQMIDALKEAAGSGWAQTWEILFGNFEEAKKLWTAVNNVVSDFINSQSNARNELLQGWKDLGGRAVLIDGLKNAFDALTSAIKPIVQAFRDIFPPTTAKRLYSLTESFKNFTARLKLSEKASNNLKDTFKGLFAVLDIVKQIFSSVYKAIRPLFGGMTSLGGGVLSVTGAIGRWLTKVDEFIKQSETLNKAVQGIADFLRLAMDAVKKFISVVKEKFASPAFEVLSSLLERIKERMSQIGSAATDMKSGVVSAIKAMGDVLANSKFVQFLQKLWDFVKKLGSGIVGIFKKIAKAISDNLSGAGLNGLLDAVNTASFGAIAAAITKFVKSFKGAVDKLDGIKDSFDGILSGVTSCLNGVKDCLTAYQQQLKAGVLLKIAEAIALLAGAILVLSLIDSDKLNSAIGGITMLFADLMASMAAFNKISGEAKSVMKSVGAMLGISASVLILAAALKKIGDLNFGELATGVAGIAGLTAIIVVAAKSMSKNSRHILKGASQTLIFAAAIKVLASACKDLSELNWEQLAKGLVGVGTLMAEIAIFLRTAEFSRKAKKTSEGILILSAAIKILASACEDFSGLDWEQIAKGLTGVGALLLEVAAFTNLTGNAKRTISTGVAMVAIAAAMKIFAAAASEFGRLNWGQIAKGLIAMGGALAEVAIAVNIMPKNMVRVGTGLIAVAAALEITADVLGKLGRLSWGEIAKGLTALGGAIAELSVGLILMKGTLSGSAALLVATTALLVLTPILKILGGMSWGEIAKGLVSIAGAIAVLGIAGAVLGPLVPAILGLSAAFTLIGVGIVAAGAGFVAAGAGLSAIAVGITALAASLAAGAAAIIAGITVIITGIIGLIPAILKKIGEGIVAFCNVIGDSAKAIGEAVKAVVLTLVDVLVECVPPIADGVLQLVAGVLDALVKYTPQIVDSLFKFLIGLLEGVANNLPALIKAAIDVVMSFFAGVVEALQGIDVDVLIKGIAGVGLLAGIMAALAAVASLIPGAMVGVLGMGAVIAELALVLAAVGALAQIPGLSWLINEGAELMRGIGNAIGSMIGGIVGGIMEGVAASLPQIGTDLSLFMTNLTPFIEGAKSLDVSAMEGVRALAETILILTAADILNGLTSWLTGGSSMTKFAEQLVPFGRAMKDFSAEIAGIDGETVSNAATAGKTLAEMAATLPNSGGVLGFFTGENDMDKFAEQLAPFGKAMVEFSRSVTGLKPDAVTNAATAGKAVAEMASTLPNSGGVVSWFTGNNDMDDFAEQLVPFGEAMMKFSQSVTGMDPEVVANAATAGKAMSEMASTLPNSGGVVSWFTGNNDLDDFGEKLVVFGESMAAYSESVKNIDSRAINNSAIAGEALVKLSETLPNSGGVVSWFTGDNDIGQFGKSLETFGNGLSKYSESVQNVNTPQLQAVCAEVNRLVDMAKGAVGLDSSGLTSFGNALTEFGKAGVDGLIKAFDNSYSRINAAASKTIGYFIDGANSRKSDLVKAFSAMANEAEKALTSDTGKFKNAGTGLMSSFIDGISNRSLPVRTAIIDIIGKCLNVIKNKYSDFTTSGKQIISQLISGINAQVASVKRAFTSIASSAVSSVKGYYSQFQSAGSYLVDGFAAGITKNSFKAQAKAKAMASSALSAAKKALGIHSPSKEFYKVGEYAGTGFINALKFYDAKAAKAGEEMASSATNGLNAAVRKIVDFVNGDADAQPVIRPVLDLSNVERGAERIDAMFSRTQALSVNARLANLDGEQNQNGSLSSGGAVFNFTQNNYSPKALSRIDVYRQTRNQFAAMKEAFSGT